MGEIKGHIFISNTLSISDNDYHIRNPVCFRRHCDTLLQNDIMYPAHEVNYEQSIVAPAANLLLEMYLVTGDASYRQAAARAGEWAYENQHLKMEYRGGTCDNLDVTDKEAGIYALFGFWQPVIVGIQHLQGEIAALVPKPPVAVAYAAVHIVGLPGIVVDKFCKIPVMHIPRPGLAAL